MAREYGVRIEEGVRPLPEAHELSAARILARHWRREVCFVRRGTQASADLLVGGVLWEIKSPIGNGKRTIQNNLREATRQSRNIVVDLRRCRMTTDGAIARIRYELKYQLRGVRRLVAILKDGKVVDIK